MASSPSDQGGLDLAFTVKALTLLRPSFSLHFLWALLLVSLFFDPVPGLEDFLDVPSANL